MARLAIRPSKSIAAVSALALALAGTVLVAPAAHADGPTNFPSTTPIAVPGLGSENQIGLASPYPSTMTVSGMAGTITNLEVTLHDVTASVLNDFDVLLVGPTGANLVVLSDPGDDPNATTLTWANNVDLTFADGGAAFPVLEVPTGTYRPTNINPGDVFPAPAPTPSSMTTLAAAFNGTDPNGTWSLFVVDDNTGDTGVIAGGWSLEVTTGEVVQPGQLAISAPSFRGVESQGSIELTVQRTGGTDGVVSVSYATQDGTAVAGTDYTATTGTLSFADGQDSATISIPVLDDDLDQSEVAFTVSLSAPQGGATLGARTSASVIIENDDGTGNPGPILVPTVGSADPYPSNIHVQGQGTYLTDVDVTVHGLRHSFLGDFDILLVGPAGQSVLLLSDVGANNLQNLTLTFDDDAASAVADPVVSGTYRPTDEGDATDSFPAPAPGGPYGSSLSVFNGTDPNGTWRLFVVDDATGDSGQITGGWELELTTGTVEAGGPYNINEGSALTLAGSTDLPGATIGWDLDGDGDFDDAAGPSPTISAAALAVLGLDDGPHTQTISVQATAGGATLTADTTLTVANVAPTATIANDGPVTIGEAAVVTLSALDDVSDADLAAGLDWTVDFDGDGTADSSGTWNSGDADPTVTVSASVLNDAGSFVVSAAVADKDGGTLQLSTTVVVDSTTPTATLTGDSVDEGGAATVTFSDPVDTAPDATFTYSFDFDGDGTFDVVDATSAEGAVPADLTADGPATVTVTGRIANQYGGFSEYEVDVVVANLAPTGTLANNGPVLIGTDAEVTLSGLGDPSAADVAAGLTWSVDLDGDGIIDDTDTWTTGDPDPVFTLPAGVLADVGPHEVTAEVRDKDTGLLELATTVVVQATLPTATFTGDTVGEGSTATVTFSDQADTAPGAVFTYSFDFDGDGTFDVVDATDASAQLPAELTDDGPATLTVTGRIANQFGGYNDYEADVVVTEVPPTVTMTLPAGARVGDQVNLVVDITDPSSADESAGFDVTVDFGDGTVVNSPRPVPTAFRGFQPMALAGATDFTHTYTQPGTYVVTVTVVDAAGVETVVSGTIVIEAAPTPTATASPTASPTATTQPSASPSSTSTATGRPTSKPYPTTTRPGPGRPGLPSSGV